MSHREDDEEGQENVQVGENSQIAVYGRVRPSVKNDTQSFAIEDGEWQAAWDTCTHTRINNQLM